MNVQQDKCVCGLQTHKESKLELKIVKLPFFESVMFSLAQKQQVG